MEENKLKKKILIVDDDEFFIEFESAFLQREHFRILEARNGETALDVMRKRKPDLVLLDLYMPGMDGMEVVVRARAEGMMDLPIIMVSKEEDHAKIRELMEAGATDFLTKPIEIEELLEKVNNFLNEAHRSGHRLPVKIKLRYRTLGELMTGESKDLSTTGIFVRTKKALEVGSLVELFLYPADNKDAEPIQLMGEVVRNEEPHAGDPGAALKFINLSPQSVQHITALLDEERKRNKVDIIVVDDDRMIQEMLRDSLTEAGFSVKVCGSAVEALKTLDICSPSMILADIMMPGMNGLEFCETFRKNSRYQDIPFIFISSKVDKETLLKARKSGAAFFMAKPFDVKNLISKVAQILG